MNRFALACPLLLALMLGAQTKGQECCMGGGMRGAAGTAPIAGNPVVEVSGTISEVHIGVGQGMPYVDVKKGSDTTRLYLGAMHYLIAQDFSPRTGQQVLAKGYKMADGVVGIQVSLPAEKKTLKLRDEKGFPLWRGGPGRQQPVQPKAQ
jgi:hypothetical protein